VQNWNQSYRGCDFSSYSLSMLWDGTLPIMSYASSITCASVSLLLAHHEPCLTFRGPVQRSDLLPLFHLQQHLWMVYPFFPSVIFQPHFGHIKTFLSNPASWRNSRHFVLRTATKWCFIHSFILYLHSIDPILVTLTRGYRNRQTKLIC